MSVNQQRENSGVLFRNDRKAIDAQPDYTGSATVNGVEFRLSAWIKTGAKGKFMSLAFSPKDANTAKPQRTYAQRRDDMDSEIPF